MVDPRFAFTAVKVKAWNVNYRCVDPRSLVVVQQWEGSLFRKSKFLKDRRLVLAAQLDGPHGL